MVPSCACEGELYGSLGVPSSVTWYCPEPSGLASQTLPAWI